MATRYDELCDWILDAIKANGSKASVTSIAKWIWLNHEADLRGSGDLFYTWQYDMRWAGKRLRDRSKIEKDRDGWRLL
jgi:hypothetical protein